MPCLSLVITTRLLESLDQCATSQPGMMKLEVVECVRKICESLEDWCEGRHFPPHLVAQVNKLYPSLENTDFLGEQTLQICILTDLNIYIYRSSYLYK